MTVASFIAFLKAVPQLVSLIVELKDAIIILSQNMKLKEVAKDQERHDALTDALIKAKTKQEVRDAINHS